jgi:hypothetical protein
MNAIITEKETYLALKKRHSEEINGFKGMFFAFSNQQAEEALKELGINGLEAAKGKFCSIGCGGYILKDRKPAFVELMNRHGEELKNALNRADFMAEALRYELANHEYEYTRDPADSLNSLGLSYADIPDEIKKAVGI